MDWKPLDSSNLQAYRYDPETRLLQIRFMSGKSYNYNDVPQDVADGLGTASSPGQYFNSSIKNTYG
jgi:lysyl-tRNA synthetase class 2